MIDGANAGGCRAAPFHTAEKTKYRFLSVFAFYTECAEGDAWLKRSFFFSLDNRRSIVCLKFFVPASRDRISSPFDQKGVG
jgi:hypothetical protein